MYSRHCSRQTVEQYACPSAGVFRAIHTSSLALESSSLLIPAGLRGGQGLQATAHHVCRNTCGVPESSVDYCENMESACESSGAKSERSRGSGFPSSPALFRYHARWIAVEQADRGIEGVSKGKWG